MRHHSGHLFSTSHHALYCCISEGMGKALVAKKSLGVMCDNKPANNDWHLTLNDASNAAVNSPGLASTIIQINSNLVPNGGLAFEKDGKVTLRHSIPIQGIEAIHSKSNHQDGITEIEVLRNSHAFSYEFLQKFDLLDAYMKLVVEFTALAPIISASQQSAYGMAFWHNTTLGLSYLARVHELTTIYRIKQGASNSQSVIADDDMHPEARNFNLESAWSPQR